MADSTIDQQPLLIAPIGADVAASKTNTDYRIRVGEANGLATLDINGKVTPAQIPTITLSGDVSGSGTTAITVVVADDSHLHTIPTITGLQTALDGKQPVGNYASATHNHTLDGLSNVTITSNTAGELLKWTGTAWINNTLAEAGIQPAGSYAAAVHTHAASDITSGTMATARLGSGTANTSTWLRGDGTWQALPAAATPTWGSIIGTLSNQTDLQSALNAKQDGDADLTAIAGLAGTSGLLRKTAANTWTLDTSSYLTGNQTITLTGDVSGSGTTSIAVTVADGSHNHIIANVDGLQTTLDAKLDDSQASATGLAVLGAADQDAARDAIGVYVQAGDPGAVADGSLWIW